MKLYSYTNRSRVTPRNVENYWAVNLNEHFMKNCNGHIGGWMASYLNKGEGKEEDGIDITKLIEVCKYVYFYSAHCNQSLMNIKCSSALNIR